MKVQREVDALWRAYHACRDAAQVASDCGDEGAWEDLAAICGELHRVAEAVALGKKLPRRQRQEVLFAR